MKQSRAEVQKRHNQILELLNKKGSLSVFDASKLLNISEITIRRDFDLLESKGLLIRFHGGASLKPQVSDESPKFKSKESMNYSQKVQIAKVVASLINDNDTVFINAGTTTFEVIRELSKKPIKIITNSVPVPSLFENSPSRLISTGGEFNAKNQSFTGDLATSIVNKIYASACVLGVNGFSSTDGITTADYLETMINELFLKRCKGLKIVAADGSKIGKTFCFTSASLSYIDILVTDSSANRDELAKFKELGIKIIIADAVQ